MRRKNSQISILALQTLMSFIAVGFSWWNSRVLSLKYDDLLTHNSAIENDYRIRAHAMKYFMQLEGTTEHEKKTRKIARNFSQYLTNLDKLGEQSNAMLSETGKDARLFDLDRDDGDLEVLVLTTTAKFSPGVDRSFLVLFFWPRQ